MKPNIGRESQFLPTPPAFDAPCRGFPSEYCRKVSCGKLEWYGCPTVRNLEDVITRFDRIYESDGQTDGRTDTARRSIGRAYA